MSLPSLQENHFHYLLGLLIILLAWTWLRGELTPRYVMRFVESEGEPSIRLLSAIIVLIYTLCMQSKGRLSSSMVEANYLFAGSLFGLGTVKLVGKALANRAASATTVKTDNAQVDAAGDVNIQSGIIPQ